MSVYGAAKAILHSLMRVYFRSKYEGRENIPFQGGCIIAANHMSYVDPPLVGDLSAASKLYGQSRVV